MSSESVETDDHERFELEFRVAYVFNRKSLFVPVFSGKF
jgi:hypothetical protein